MRNKTCCFIGHDIVKRFGMDIELHPIIKRLIEEYGVTRFLCSGLDEFDNLCRWNANIIKSRYSGISVCRVVPEGVSLDSRINDLLFDDIIRITRTDSADGVHKWITDNSDFAICYVTDECDSAHRRKAYAEKAGLKIINVE